MSISTCLKTFLDETQVSYSVMTYTTAYTAQGAAVATEISGKERIAISTKTTFCSGGAREQCVSLAEANRVNADADLLRYNSNLHRLTPYSTKLHPGV